MGLDTYASRKADRIELTPEDEAAFTAANPQLCGGMYSGGEASFRGKVYDVLIMEATGSSLYQEWISPEEVKGMSDRLGAYTPAQLAPISEKEDGRYDQHNAGACAELQKFFRVCAERGLGLLGWW
jgi:hypothetical protein